MSKCTPGPWEVGHGGHGGPDGFVIDEYYVLNRAIADDVAIASEIIDPATGMPSEANARLIAYAHDLHAFAEAVVDACCDYLPPDGISKDEFINRIIGATDDPRIVEIMRCAS